jgi:hypothetical protein
MKHERGMTMKEIADAEYQETAESPPASGSGALIRYRVEWTHTHSMWGEVEAIDELEAVRLAQAGKCIKNTVDSEPGKNNFRGARVTLLPNPETPAA